MYAVLRAYTQQDVPLSVHADPLEERRHLDQDFRIDGQCRVLERMQKGGDAMRGGNRCRRLLDALMCGAAFVLLLTAVAASGGTAQSALSDQERLWLGE